MIEKLFFSSVILKTELNASEPVTANNYLLSSARSVGKINEKVFICLLILNSSVCFSFVFVCSINASVFFYSKAKVRFSFRESKFSPLFFLMNFLLFFESFLFCFRRIEAVFGLRSWDVSHGELLAEWIYYTLLSIVIFREVIYFEENVNVFRILW